MRVFQVIVLFLLTFLSCKCYAQTELFISNTPDTSLLNFKTNNKELILQNQINQDSVDILNNQMRINGSVMEEKFNELKIISDKEIENKNFTIQRSPKITITQESEHKNKIK